MSTTIDHVVTTPAIKVETCAGLVAERYCRAILMTKPDYATRLARERLTFIHPFDDPDVIAGAGATVGMEMLRQHADPIHAVFVPVGGGGLIAGVAAYIKDIRPGSRSSVSGRGRRPWSVRWQQDGASPCPRWSFRRRCRCKADRRGAFPYRAKDRRRMMLVSTDEICAAIRRV